MEERMMLVELTSEEAAGVMGGGMASSPCLGFAEGATRMSANEAAAIHAG